MAQVKFKKGDILKNGWAGDGNPYRYMTYLRAGTVRQGRYSHKVFECIGYDGGIIKQFQRDHRFEVVGHMPEFDTFMAALKRLKDMPCEDGGKPTLAPCPLCGRDVTMYGPDDWKPSFTDPDSGGDPVNLVCECGIMFSIGSYDYQETYDVWNRRPLVMDKKESAGDGGDV